MNKNKNFTSLKDGLNVLYYGKFYPKKYADYLFDRLEKEIEYNPAKESQVFIHGKWIDIPRKQVAFGDVGTSYTFSHNTVPTKTWTPLLLSIKKDVEKMAGKKFNFVLINRYNDGDQYIGWHSDSSINLDLNPDIASLTVGSERLFKFRNIEDNSKQLTVQLNHGSLLFMNHPTNQYWQHSLPVRKNVNRPRINLTFRNIVNNIGSDKNNKNNKNKKDELEIV